MWSSFFFIFITMVIIVKQGSIFVSGILSLASIASWLDYNKHKEKLQHRDTIYIKISRPCIEEDS